MVLPAGATVSDCPNHIPAHREKKKPENTMSRIQHEERLKSSLPELNDEHQVTSSSLQCPKWSPSRELTSGWHPVPAGDASSNKSEGVGEVRRRGISGRREVRKPCGLRNGPTKPPPPPIKRQQVPDASNLLIALEYVCLAFYVKCFKTSTGTLQPLILLNAWEGGDGGVSVCCLSPSQSNQSCRSVSIPNTCI